MIRCTLIALSSLSLVACGGGAADSEGGNNTTPGAAMTINAGNAADVVRVTYESALSTGDFVGLAGPAVLTGNSGDGMFKPRTGNPGLIDQIVQIAIGPLELACNVSGSVTVTADFADPTGQTLTAGDTISSIYDACDDGLGEVLDGRMDAEILAMNGDINLGLYDMTMRIVLDRFQSATATEVLLASGDGTARIDTFETPYVEASISGDAMTIDANADSQTLTVYSSAQTLDTGVIPTVATLSASGTLDSTQLAGSVRYSSPVLFVAFDDNYPHVGEMLIVGNDSSARLIAQENSIDVVIEIYSNVTGTGTPDETIITTWAALAGL